MNFFKTIKSDSNSTVIQADSNTELVITTKRVYKQNYSPFSMMGPINKGRDLIDCIVGLNRGPRYLFQELKEMMCLNNNIAVMTHWKELPENKKRMIKLHCTELKKAELILKVTAIGNLPKPKPFTYMINPHLIKPEDYAGASLLWETLGGKSKEDTYAI